MNPANASRRPNFPVPLCIRIPDHAILLQKVPLLPYFENNPDFCPVKEVPLGVDPFLLSILVCPKCRGSLTVRSNPDGLACQACGLLYPVRDDIPVMLVDEALPLAAAGDGRP